MKKRLQYGTIQIGAFVALCMGNYVVHAQQIGSPELQITSPSDGSPASPGQTVTIVVTPSSGIALSQVAIVGDGPLGFMQPISSTPFQFAITLPAGVSPGKYQMTAWGIDGQGQTVVSNPISIDVERSDMPLRIAPQIPQLFLPAGGPMFPLKIMATFADATLVDVTESSNLTYTSANNSVVTVSTAGLVTPAAVGTTSINLTYGTGPNVLAVSVPVSIVPTGSFSLTVSQAQATVNAGQSATYALRVTPIGGFNQTVSLSCTDALAGPTCSVSPLTVALNGATASVATVTVATTARAATRNPRFRIPFLREQTLPFMVLLVAFLMFFTSMYPRKAGLCATAFLFALTLGCAGGSGNGNGGSSAGSSGTQAGTYALTLTGSSAGLSRTRQVFLVVN